MRTYATPDGYINSVKTRQIDQPGYTVSLQQFVCNRELKAQIVQGRGCAFQAGDDGEHRATQFCSLQDAILIEFV